MQSMLDTGKTESVSRSMFISSAKYSDINKVIADKKKPPAGHDVPNRRFFHRVAMIVLFITVTPQASCTADTGSA